MNVCTKGIKNTLKEDEKVSDKDKNRGEKHRKKH